MLITCIWRTEYMDFTMTIYIKVLSKQSNLPLII